MNKFELLYVADTNRCETGSALDINQGNPTVSGAWNPPTVSSARGDKCRSRQAPPAWIVARKGACGLDRYMKSRRKRRTRHMSVSSVPEMLVWPSGREDRSHSSGAGVNGRSARPSEDYGSLERISVCLPMTKHQLMGQLGVVDRRNKPRHIYGVLYVLYCMYIHTPYIRTYFVGITRC